jgi:hypothetical protein
MTIHGIIIIFPDFAMMMRSQIQTFLGGGLHFYRPAIVFIFLLEKTESHISVSVLHELLQNDVLTSSNFATCYLS